MKSILCNLLIFLVLSFLGIMGVVLVIDAIAMAARLVADG